MSAVELVSGRREQELAPAQKSISLSDVTAGYDGKRVLRSINLEISSGQFAGFIGPNGIGKTTLFRVIMGLVKPCAGSVRVLGRPLVDEASRRWVRQQVGYLAQQNESGTMPITVMDTVLLGRWGNYQYKYWPGPEDRRAALGMLNLVGMQSFADKDWRELSGGQQQRVSLARALIRSPRLLILDEPTTYLDEPAQAELMTLVADIHRSQGLTTLMISHDTSLLRAYADSIYQLTGESVLRVVE